MILIMDWAAREKHGLKDLILVQSNCQRGVLVDDLELYVDLEQTSSWQSIDNFDGRNSADNELSRVANILRNRAKGISND